MKYRIVSTCQECNATTCVQYSKKKPVLITSELRWCAVCQKGTMNVNVLYEEIEGVNNEDN